MMFGTNIGSSIICERIPHLSVGVEIGVWRGESSEKFLKRALHLHLVDPWSVGPYEAQDFGAYLARYARKVGSSDPKRFQSFYDDVFQSVEVLFRDRPVTIHRCTSEQFFKRFTEPVDWVYIDGLHAFDACLADLHGAHRIVKPGGFIFGDDYGKPPAHRNHGVTRAVDEFVSLTGLAFKALRSNQYEIQV
jgi:hypothetical protein